MLPPYRAIIKRIGVYATALSFSALFCMATSPNVKAERTSIAEAILSYLETAALPHKLSEKLISKGTKGIKILNHFKNTPRLSEDDFLEYTASLDLRYLSSGYNGRSYVSSDQKLIAKFSHLVFEPNSSEQWKDHTLFQEFSPIVLPPRVLIEGDWLIQSKPIWKEILGSLLWASRDSAPQDETIVQILPSAISNDAQAYIRPFIQGTPLNHILEDDRSSEGTSYNMPAIWRQVSALQEEAELLLIEYGITVDMLGPGNFIVTGSYESPKVISIDHELVGPNAAARTHYAELGITLPEFNSFLNLTVVKWPLMPMHIVFSKSWALSFEQALNYIAACNPEQTSLENLQTLASVPEWPNDFFQGKNPANYSNIQRAKDIVGCVDKLTPRPKR